MYIVKNTRFSKVVPNQPSEIMKIKFVKILLAFLCMLGIVGWSPFDWFTPDINEPTGSHEWIAKEMRTIGSQANNLDSKVLRLSLIAYINARQRGIAGKPYLTIIDYSKPSRERRLWVVNLRTGKVLFNTYVTHGKNSGTAHATSFSNQPGSLKSSMGVFVTTDSSYTGSNGYSLRLVGLERGINDNAYRRAIVFHGAWYANADVIRRYGALGRSWGCPTVGEKFARPLINTIKGHSLVFVYSDNNHWLRHSPFLAG